MIDGDGIEQEPLQKSTEWHHSLIDWLSRESAVLVCQSNTHLQAINAIKPLPTSRTLRSHIEQGPLPQLPEWHHSIIDWLSREPE